MQTEALSILADLKAKREVRGSALHFTDYWRTYSLMVLYGIGLAILDLRFSARGEALLVYFATTIIVSSAIRDSQRAANRRFGAVIELLEKKGLV